MHKCLLIEDNVDHGEYVKEILFDDGWDIDIAINGKDGLDFYKKAVKTKIPYDIIITDISMPDMNGLQVIKSIRKIDDICFKLQVPIIVTTSFKYSKPFAADFGCDDFLNKPFTINELLDKVHKRLEYRY